MQYIHPENDCTLTTVNYLCELDENLNIIRTNKIDTSQFDVKPIWEFVGMEDVRLFKWDNKLYGSGVRRDTTTNGVGRMELCEYDITNNSVNEISRWRIPAPGLDNTYCEKNWMPILDKPYHYIKWSNPTEVVKIDPIEKTCVTVHLEEQRYIEGLCDFRGGSQVISWNGYYLAVIHEVRLFNSELGRKDGKYYHRFVLWDDNFNIVTFSDLFDFMEGDIEFCCGLGFKNGGFTLHLPDNANNAKHPITSKYVDLLEYISNIKDEISNFSAVSMGPIYDSISHLFENYKIYDIYTRAGNLINEFDLKPELYGYPFNRIDHGEGNVTCNCQEKLYHNVLLPNGDISLCCMD